MWFHSFSRTVNPVDEIKFDLQSALEESGKFTPFHADANLGTPDQPRPIRYYWKDDVAYLVDYIIQSAPNLLLPSSDDQASNPCSFSYDGAPIKGKESRSRDMDDNLMKYIELLDKDRRDMEKRLTDERKDSEERYNKTVDKLESKVDALSNKFDGFSENVEQKLVEQRKWLIGVLIAVVGIIVTLGIGFSQIILTILQKP